ncbi:MAG: PEP-CTERM sorting domain-containing protein, partial [Pirellula sp.]
NRTFRFVKVNGGVESAPIVINSLGTGSTNPSGTNLTSGTYRLWYEHYDPKIRNSNVVPPDTTLKVNSTNLDIRFDLVSEDGGGGTGVVPEPSSVAVFGLLGIGSAIAKWRRKK